MKKFYTLPVAVLGFLSFTLASCNTFNPTDYDNSSSNQSEQVNSGSITTTVTPSVPAANTDDDTSDTSSTSSAIFKTTISDLYDDYKTVMASDWNELRIYQIMVSSFQDGNKKIGFSCSYGPSTSYASETSGETATTRGGDLQGIINAASYIKSLGINAIWLTPIFQSAGSSEIDSTGYYAYDYFNIDSHFGTKSKFAELVDTYHELGIAVILDGVFGHNGGTVAKSPDAYGVDNPGIRPSTKNPVDYANNEDSLKFYEDVAQYWIKNYQIDGWRLDQCYQVGLGDHGKNTGTNGHNYWYEIRKTVEAAAASNGAYGTDWGTLGYMVGEHWDGSVSGIQNGSINPGTAEGYGLRSCFSFPDRYSIVNALAEAEYDEGGNSLGNALASVYKTPEAKGYTHPDGYIPNLFITNHDMIRFGNLLTFDEGLTPSDERYWKMHQLMMASMMAYTGPITVYYGDEWGAYGAGVVNKPHGSSNYVGNSAYADNAARTSGKITGFSANEQALIDYNSALLKMRASHKALWNGSYETISSNGELYVGQKSNEDETIVFALNNSSKSASFEAEGMDLISGEEVKGSVTVGPYEARFILVK